ncbi:histidinol dehydrogenase [Amphibacillus indicireducens]|uniref:Histidinol dehydrogenase n=1 Tax=Amphibacillus indicireducens TaxID=1076330 RepID=A0ABP7VL27_9BACI
MVTIYQAKEFEALLKNQKKTSLQSDQAYQVAKEVIGAIQEEGDLALDRYVEKFDGRVPDNYVVSDEERKQAWEQISPKTIDALKRAAKNIESFHAKQVNQSKFMQTEPDIISGQIYTPVDKVGIYVPGGTACYPSSVFMNAIPAVLAGVKEVVMVTPARSGEQIEPILSVAADICGVSKIYKIGGIQAVAALAYGTETVEPVDKIVGPGNAYVAAAKALVYGDVGIDMIAGPSEVAIIADDSANPVYVAADLIAQAEHDTLARAFLISTSDQLIRQVEQELEAQLAVLPRADIAGEAIKNYGGLIKVDNLAEAFRLSNIIAPEHLEIQLNDSLSYLGYVKHAGSIFLGHYTPESLGDYYAGPNHVLPTSGTAKFSSGLSVADFVKTSTFLYYTEKALKQAADDVIQIAEEEQLSGHARAVAKRIK